MKWKFKGRKPLPEALKTEGLRFNEIEVHQTTLAPFKISDQWLME
jgi:uroporphyrinogen-III synthase